MFSLHFDWQSKQNLIEKGIHSDCLQNRMKCNCNIVTIFCLWRITATFKNQSDKNISWEVLFCENKCFQTLLVIQICFYLKPDSWSHKTTFQANTCMTMALYWFDSLSNWDVANSIPALKYPVQVNRTTSVDLALLQDTDVVVKKDSE